MVRASICCCRRKSHRCSRLLFPVAAAAIGRPRTRRSGGGRGCEGSEVGQQCHEKPRNGHALIRLPLAGDRSKERTDVQRSLICCSSSMFTRVELGTLPCTVADKMDPPLSAGAFQTGRRVQRWTNGSRRRENWSSASAGNLMRLKEWKERRRGRAEHGRVTASTEFWGREIGVRSSGGP